VTHQGVEPGGEVWYLRLLSLVCIVWVSLGKEWRSGIIWRNDGLGKNGVKIKNHWFDRLWYPELGYTDLDRKDPSGFVVRNLLTVLMLFFVAQRRASKCNDDWTHFHYGCFRCTLFISVKTITTLALPRTKPEGSQFLACSSRYCCRYFTRSVLAEAIDVKTFC